MQELIEQAAPLYRLFFNPFMDDGFNMVAIMFYTVIIALIWCAWKESI